MNTEAQKLVDNINELTKNSPLIYFCRDAERALGLENILKNYYIVCIEKSHITKQFNNAFPGRIFCAEEKGIILKTNSTLELINNPEVIKWVKQITHNAKFYAQLFQFNNPTTLKLKELGATILNNEAKLNRLFEDKFSQLKLLTEGNIKIPKSKIIETKNIEYSLLVEEFRTKFVIQLDRAHTGSGTFIINNQDEFVNFQSLYGGNIVKVSEFIDGEAYTINACITRNGTFINGLQYQITGYSELTPSKGSTVGNDWSYANQLDFNIKKTIFNTINNIAAIMNSHGFKGLFGVDLIIRNKEVFVIEINARQTANISLQIKLEIQQNQIPLELLHLAEFMNLEFNTKPWIEIVDLEGSQIFLRAKNDNFKISNHTLSSGIYRLQSDNSALNWSFDKIKIKIKGIKPKVIFIDEEKDKPLIWQNDGYSIDDVKDAGFVLLIQNSGIKNKFEEVARMQFTNQIVYNNKVNPWIIEALVNIENLIR